MARPPPAFFHLVASHMTGAGPVKVAFMSGAIGFIFAVRLFIAFWIEGLNDARFVIDSMVKISKVLNEM